jgi:hypothetical protein
MPRKKGSILIFWLKRCCVAALAIALITGWFATAGTAQQTPVAPPSLAAALAEAKPGAVLLLAGGVYGSLSVKGLAGEAGNPITLRSADPANPARFSRMTLNAVSHLILQDLEFQYRFEPGDKTNLRPFQVFAARDVVLRKNLFEGDVARGVSSVDDGYPSAFGLSITSSAEVLVDENEIRGFFRGMVTSDSVDVTIRGNDLHGLRMDGMNFAQVERVLIERNFIHDFKRALDSKDHADMIQFWTNGTERPSTDITIQRNILNSGAGWYTQSIFMRNDLVDRGLAGAAMFFRDVKIVENVIINAHLHGITVGETSGLLIANNTVVRNASSQGKSNDPGLWTPQIRVAPTSTDVSILRNVVGKITGPAGQSGWTVEDNFLVQDVSARMPNHYDTVFVAASSGDPQRLASFAYLAGGPLDGAGIGAAILAEREPQLPGVLVPLIRVLPDREFANRFTFDATSSVLAEGMTAEDVKYRWTFGEEAIHDGAKAEHTFKASGPTRILLSMMANDGQSASTETLLFVPGPLVLRFDPQTGAFTSFVAREPVSPDIALEPGGLVLGQGAAVVVIPPAMIGPLFDSEEFDLTMRVKGFGGAKGAGELLRIHQTLLVTVTQRGMLDIRFDTSDADQLKLLAGPVRIYSDQWRDIGFHYSAKKGLFWVDVDGRTIAQGRTTGRVRPMEHWGLAFGNQFSNRKTFDGVMESMTLYVNRSAFAAVP